MKADEPTVCMFRVTHFFFDVMMAQPSTFSVVIIKQENVSSEIIPRGKVRKMMEKQNLIASNWLTPSLHHPKKPDRFTFFTSKPWKSDDENEKYLITSFSSAKSSYSTLSPPRRSLPTKRKREGEPSRLIFTATEEKSVKRINTFLL